MLSMQGSGVQSLVKPQLSPGSVREIKKQTKRNEAWRTGMVGWGVTEETENRTQMKIVGHADILVDGEDH